MKDDYRVYHNRGYETIEGITAGTKAMVAYDTYLDGGVSKSEASTDSPYSPMILKTRDGRMISDRNGNLFTTSSNRRYGKPKRNLLRS